MSSFFWNSAPPHASQPPGTGGGWPGSGWNPSPRWLGPPLRVGGGGPGLPGGAVPPQLTQTQIDNINNAIANYHGPLSGGLAGQFGFPANTAGLPPGITGAGIGASA